MATNTNRKKRLIVAASNKGGVGKSFFLVQLIEWLKEHPTKPTYAAFDPDEANKTLTSFHKDCTTFVDLDLGNEALDQVVTTLNDVDISILDGLGSQQDKTVLAWLKEVDLFNQAAAMGLRITFVCMIEEDRDVLLQTKAILEEIGDKVDWVFAVNCKAAKQAFLWNNSQVRQLGLLDLKGQELEFHRLPAQMATYMNSNALTLSAGRTDPRIDFLGAGRYRTHWKTFTNEFDKAAEYFLPPVD